MADISDVYNAEGLVNYYTTLKNGGDPHYKFIGESLFPNAKRKGLRLDWIKGLNGIPAVLKQSNLDATLKQMEMADKEFEYTVEDTTADNALTVEPVASDTVGA